MRYIEEHKAMNGKAQPLYFDEAGFTGNNLLDPEQPAFVYAGVAMDKEHAAQLHSDTLSRFRINAQELKGANLLKKRKGRRAISWLLAETSRYSYVMVANKEYALAGKFFEHIFEPALSERNSLFYAIGFHRFIATLLYMCNRAADPDVGSTLRNFADMMRSMNPDQLDAVLAPLDQFDQSDPIGMVLAFALCHQSSIKHEIKVMRDSGSLANWSLELSMTALHWLLASCGEEFEVLEVYCDESKPIQEGLDFFDVFIGREDKLYLRFGDKPNPSFIYNLASPINLVDSKTSPGVQIADVLASSLSYAKRNPDEAIAEEWIDILKDVPANQIIPEMDDVDLTKEHVFINSMVLRELVDRSVRGQNLFEGMDDFVLSVQTLFPRYVDEVLSHSLETNDS